ncbi:unnamed protein product [Hapterophycus canaliculatus]
MANDSASDTHAVESFREFLRIRSISADGPEGAYGEAAKWISDYARDRVGLTSITTVEYATGKPVVLIEWPGTEPDLPCVLLNSHYDVVPAMPEHWDTDPFEAAKDEANGRIYGRGTQDMKCVCIQYLVAISRLRRSGFIPTRTVHLSFVPDEEIGGADGICLLLASEEWKALQPVGVALDEGLANPKNAFTVFYGERTPWWLLVKAEGPTGHGSRFIKDTAVQKLMAVCDKALAFRKEQEDALGHSGGCSHARAKKLGDVTTLNLTMLKAGVAMAGGGDDGGGKDGDETGGKQRQTSKEDNQRYALNVIPTEARAGFDVRIDPNTPTEDFKARLAEWCKEEGVTWELADWTTPLHEHYLTSVDREKNPWWGVFLDTMKDLDVEIEPEIFPASTDSRYLRELGIPALGFSPMRNTPILLHDHNEYIDQGIFEEGIRVYERLISALASSERLPTEE